jgi:hypothetical protein
MCLSPTHLKCLPNYINTDLEIANNANQNWTCPTCLSEFFPFANIETGDEFMDLLSPNECINFEQLEELLLNPFDCNEQEDILDDIDPDGNFYNSTTYQSPKTYYFSPDAFNDKLHNHSDLHYFSTFHTNIRS